MVTVVEAATRRPRKLNAADKRAINRVACQNMLAEIQELEMRAHGLGMLITGRALNQAKNALGWELAGESLAADRARSGQCVDE